MKKIILFLSMTFAITAATAQPNYGWTAVSTSTTTPIAKATGRSVVTDSKGNVYTTGYFIGTVDFDPGKGTCLLTTPGGGINIFIQKLDANGKLVWAKSVGNVNNSIGYGIAVDTKGNVYTTGYFVNTVDFDPGDGTFNMTSKGGMDIFILKLDADGKYVWAKSMGSGTSDAGYGITADTKGNVYTIGAFNEMNVDFDPGSGTAYLSSAGADDIFIQKLDADGKYVWAKSMGGANADMGYGIAVDGSGYVYTTGYFYGTVNFDTGGDTATLTSAGNDIFIQKLDANGKLVWAKSMGGANADMGYGIAVDAKSNVYSTGYFNGTVVFDATNGTPPLTSAGNDIFVQKLDADGKYLWAKSMGGSSSDIGYSIALDVGSNAYITGVFAGTEADFDPGTGIAKLTSAGNTDVFIQKLNADGTFAWAKSMGGSGPDYSYGIAVDGSGNVYTSGYFTSPDGSTPVNMNPVGGTDNKQGNTVAIFIQKLTK